MRISAVTKSSLIDYPGKISAIIFTAGCNFRCGYCHNPEMVIPGEIQKRSHTFLSEYAVLRFLESRVWFLDGVSICGGEPTLQADLMAFIKKVKSLGFAVKLDTNGTNPNMLFELLSKNLLDYVAMDIKHAPNKYPLITGGIGWDACKESMNMIKDSWVDHEFRTTTAKGVHSQKDIHEIAKAINGAKRYFLQNFRSGKTLDENYAGKSFSMEELEEFVQTASSYIDMVAIRN